jgi:hypothetical protein
VLTLFFFSGLKEEEGVGSEIQIHFTRKAKNHVNLERVYG